MKASSVILTGMASAMLVAACGGGGGGGGAAGGLLPGVAITQVNAPDISSEVLDSANAANGQASSANLLTGVVVNTSGGNFSYTDFIVNQLTRLPALQNANLTNSLSGAVLNPTTVPCSSGFVRVSGNVMDIANLNDWFVGDVLNAEFTNCTDFGLTLNGFVEYAVTTAVPNGLDGTPPYTLGMQIDMDNFTVFDGVDTITGDGDVTILLDDDSGLGGSGDIQATISGFQLISTVNGDTYTMTAYNYDIIDNTITNDYSFDIMSTVSSAKIGGSVTVTTPTPFTGTGTADPTGGVALITTSADQSNARVTALANGTDVMIDVDEDGDTIYEVNLMRTWAQLDAL